MFNNNPLGKHMTITNTFFYFKSLVKMSNSNSLVKYLDAYFRELHI